MNRETSLYLDLIRFVASMVVFLGHVAGERFTGGLFWQLGAYMDDAVIVFFVLSGFVISYVVGKSESGMEEFAIARSARIYSVALPALCLTFIFDFLGIHLNGQLYSAEWGYQHQDSAWQFFSGLVFLNEFWMAPVPVGSMLPYWSLAYEVWYYVLFAALYFARGMSRILAVIVVCAIAGPKILVLFPLWLLGYCTYIFSARKSFPVHLGCLLFISSIVGYMLHRVYFHEMLSAHAGLSTDIFAENFLSRYVVAVLFALHLAGFVWASPLIGKYLNRWAAGIRWLAGATFTIYLMHLPVAQFFTTIVPWAPSDWRTRVVLIAGTFICVLIIANFTERRKQVWLGLIRKIYEVYWKSRMSVIRLKAQDS